MGLYQEFAGLHIIWALQCFILRSLGFYLYERYRVLYALI